MGLFSKKKNLVGLDIGSSSVKAVEMKPGKAETWQLSTIGLEYLPQEAIVDGQIMDSTSVIDAIQRLFSEYRIKTTEVATAISGSSVIVKKIQLPAMSEQELAESIHWEAEQYIPFDIQEVNLDYQVLDPGGAGGNMDILLVAAKKDKINDYQARHGSRDARRSRPARVGRILQLRNRSGRSRPGRTKNLGRRDSLRHHALGSGFPGLGKPGPSERPQAVIRRRRIGAGLVGLRW